MPIYFELKIQLKILKDAASIDVARVSVYQNRLLWSPDW